MDKLAKKKVLINLDLEIVVFCLNYVTDQYFAKSKTIVTYFQFYELKMTI